MGQTIPGGPHGKEEEHINQVKMWGKQCNFN